MTDPPPIVDPVPLPANGAPWPPRAWAPILDDIRTADAWYSGDPTRLADVYANDPKDLRNPTLRDRLWARAQPLTDRQRLLDRIHVPAAADIAATSADLLFGGDLRLQDPDAHGNTVDENETDEAAEARTAGEDHLAELADTIGLANTLLEGAELASGLSGVYLRPTWDRELAARPFLDVVHPDRAIPEFRSGRLSAVTFWRIIADDGIAVLRHLERHEPGVILHALYVGTPENLGQRRDLNTHPDTAGLDDAVDLRSLGITDRLLARYVPNALPNRKRRHVPYGRPDTAGYEALMDGLDETMTAWVREIRLGKLRVIVDQDYLKRSGRGEGASFDRDAEVFSPLNLGPGSPDQAATIQPIEFQLRTEKFHATCDALFERIVVSSGYSPQSFGLADGAAQTATEVRSRDDRSTRTTGKKRRYWGPQIAEACRDLLAIDRAVFDSGVDPFTPRLVWPDLNEADPKGVAETLNLLHLAQAASIETRVRMLNPDLEPAEVAAEVDRIRAEQGITVDDPTGGLP